MSDAGERVDRLLDAIELVKEDRRQDAQQLLRQLVNEDSDFEDAWLWLSVAVDDIDKSAVCLDNVLRVNPGNQCAAGALSRIREPEMQMQRRRGRYLLLRDTAFVAMWMLILGLFCAITLMMAMASAPYLP